MESPFSLTKKTLETFETQTSQLEATQKALAEATSINSDLLSLLKSLSESCEKQEQTTKELMDELASTKETLKKKEEEGKALSKRAEEAEKEVEELKEKLRKEREASIRPLTSARATGISEGDQMTGGKARSASVAIGNVTDRTKKRLAEGEKVAKVALETKKIPVTAVDQKGSIAEIKKEEKEEKEEGEQSPTPPATSGAISPSSPSSSSSSGAAPGAASPSNPKTQELMALIESRLQVCKDALIASDPSLLSSIHGNTSQVYKVVDLKLSFLRALEKPLPSSYGSAVNSTLKQRFRKL